MTVGFVLGKVTIAFQPYYSSSLPLGKHICMPGLHTEAHGLSPVHSAACLTSLRRAFRLSTCLSAHCHLLCPTVPGLTKKYRLGKSFLKIQILTYSSVGRSLSSKAEKSFLTASFTWQPSHVGASEVIFSMAVKIALLH